MLQALEAKLATCRNFVKDQPRSGKIGGNSPMNSPRYVEDIFVEAGSQRWNHFQMQNLEDEKTTDKNMF